MAPMTILENEWVRGLQEELSLLAKDNAVLMSERKQKAEGRPNLIQWIVVGLMALSLVTTIVTVIHSHDQHHTEIVDK